MRKLTAVGEFTESETKCQVRSSLGLAGYYRRCIPDYFCTAAPLTDLTRKSALNIVVWGKECEDAFGRLKGLLCSKPALSSPGF